MKKQVGIYKLTYKPTKEFYIGATSNLYSRWHSHKSHFKAGRHHSLLQTLYDVTKDINDWKLELIETCTVKKLNSCEQVYLDKYRNNVRCLNSRPQSFGGRRKVTINETAKDNLAISLLGKNTTDGIRRPNNLTFISPEGTEYPNILSVKRFAEEHDLNQAQMNNLANGKLDSYYGWTRKDSDLPFASSVIEYWSRERMLQNFTEYTVIGPDKKAYKTFVLYYFEQEHKCKIAHAMLGNMGVKSNLKGLDELGRGYRLATVPYFKVTYNGKTYDNVISLSKWAVSVGLTQRQFTYHFRTINNKKRNNVRSVDLQIEKIVPAQ